MLQQGNSFESLDVAFQTTWKVVYSAKIFGKCNLLRFTDPSILQFSTEAMELDHETATHLTTNYPPVN